MTERKSFGLPEEDEANILIYNVKGQVVRGMGTKPLKAFANTTHWDGNDNSDKPVSNGCGVDRINTGHELHARKILIIK